MSTDLPRLKAKVEVLERDYARAKADYQGNLERTRRGEGPTSSLERAAWVMVLVNYLAKAEDLVQAYRELVEILWEREQPEPP